MLMQGITLLLIGMSTVFVFLVLLIVAMNCSAGFFKKFAHLFPEETVEMISVAEEANNLEQVLVDVADGMERRTYRYLELFVRLLEPAMLLVMAVLVLFVMLGLLLPVLQSSSMI